MVDLARKNLLYDKLRFLITVSGVAFAVTLVFVQVGLFLGGFVTPLAQHLQRQLTQAAEVSRAEHAVDPPPAAGPHFDHSAVYPG